MATSEFRYSLTSICLRLGQMALPQKMLKLFPQEGIVKAVDTVTNEEIELDFKPPRIVVGLADFYNRHQLRVNDKIEIRLEEGNCYSLTPVKIVRKADYSSPEALEKILDDLLKKAVPLSESEIRETFPEIPKSIDLNFVLKQDKRFVRHEGRWRPKQESELPLEVEPLEEIDQATVGQATIDPITIDPVTVSQVNVDQVAKVNSFSSAPKNASSRATTQNAYSYQNKDGQALRETTRINADSSSPRNPFAKGAIGNSLLPNAMQLDDSIDATKTLVLEESDLPAKRLPQFLFPQNTTNEKNNTSSHKRIRETFEKLGYKLKILSQDQLILKADLGRYKYDTLVYLLLSKQSLDWAYLLNSRRELGVKYLAIFGEHRDLLKLHSSIDLARATLWSWQGTEHLKDIMKKVPISPIDLEPFFTNEGLFEEGISSFEQMIYARIAEQGVFSNILSILASFKPPCVFLLDDITLDATFPREQLAKVLDTLSQAPFQLLSKVADGEYNMRSTVSDALLNFSEYSLSVRDRLHKHRNGRMRLHPHSSESQVRS